MSGKAEKVLRKAEKEKQENFAQRREAMYVELKKLSEIYKIDIVGYLQYTEQGAIPMVALIDVKDKYEHTTEEAKKAESNGKIKLKV